MPCSEFLPPVTCADCGAAMELVTGRSGLFFWGCTRFPACAGRHRAHASGAPIGVPGDWATRAARSQCHKVFDALLVQAGVPRWIGYVVLSEMLGVPERSAHFGGMNLTECKVALDALRRLKHSRLRKHWQRVIRGRFNTGKH